MVVVAGHSDTFAFGPDGAVVGAWDGWPLPRTTTAVAWTGDGLLADLPPVLPPSPDRPSFRVDPALAGRRVYLGRGATPVDRGPARLPPRVEVDGDTVVVHRGDGPRRLSVPRPFLDPRVSADGATLAARTHEASLLLDVDTGRVAWRGRGGELPCPSADGRWAAVLPWGAARIARVEVATGRLHTAAGPGGPTPHVALSAERVVIGDCGRASVLGRRDGALRGVLEGATGPFAAAPGGWVGVAGPRRLAAWDPDGGPAIGGVELDAKPLGFAADALGRVLVGRHETGGLCLRDLPDLWRAAPASGSPPERLVRPADLLRTVAASPDGRWWLLSGPEGTELLDADLGPVASWGGTEQTPHAFSPDGRALARLTEDRLEVLDLDGRVVAGTPAEGAVLGWGPDGPVTASGWCAVRWSRDLVARERRPLEARATGVELDAAGFAWVGDDGVARIEDWDLSRG